jgi:L-arabinose transport system substrate-binding protein
MRVMTVLAGVVMGVLAVGFGGCGGGGSDSGGAGTQAGGGGGQVKIGFIVKQPEEPWFQREWRFADETAAKEGFTVIHQQGQDGERVSSAIQNLATQGAKGFVICTPDVKLGPAILAQAQANGMKVVAVDDQLVGPKGEPLAGVPYLGIEAKKIGEVVGKTLFEQMKARGWTAADTAVCAVTFEELPTAKDRTDGAIEALAAAGFAKEKIYKAPISKSDQEQANTATTNLLTQHPEVKHWLICGMNDSVVMGAVRAMEQRGLKAGDVIGVGINGDQVAIDELKRSEATGFYGSVLLSARQHGSETVEMLYKWIKEGTEPKMDTRTTGVVINRENFKQVLKEQGVE